MQKQLTRFLAVVSVVLLMTSAAGAVPFSDGGASLQAVLNNITKGPVAGQSSVNVLSDEIADGSDAYWSITGTGGSLATIIIELAGNANSNTFGVYDAANPASMVQLFAGNAAAGSQAILSILFDGSVVVNFADTGVDFASNSFGYYLNGPGGTWKSDTSLNADSMDHMAAYQGKNIDTVQILPYSPGVWTDNEFVLAFEDLAITSGGDYDDFVVMVESVLPVPEPAAILLIGSGLLGLAGIGRRNPRRQG